jgi:hypothetical protein
MDAGGFVKGNISWDSGNSRFTGTSGFFLGYASSQYRFFIGQTGNPGIGSGNYLYWDGATLKVGGNIVSGTTVGSDSDSNSVGLRIASGYGIRRTNSNGVLTINGGDGNGVNYAAQIDLSGSFLNTGGTDTGNGSLTLSAGYNVSNSFQGPYDGSIVFRTSHSSTVGSAPNTTDVGIQRMVIALDGTVVVGKGNDPVVSGAPNSGEGKFIATTSITAGGSDLAGNNSNGTIYVRNNSNTANITLTGSTGDVTAIQFTTSSSKRFKTKIKKLNKGIDAIKDLNPVSFVRKDNRDKKEIGFIAEEMNDILPEVVKKDANNDPEGIDYSKLTVLLVSAVKELSAKINELELKLNANTN